MRTQETDIREILKTLSQHSEIMSDAYYGDGVLMTDETQDAVGTLVANGALSPYGEDSFMLSPDLRSFLDHATHRQRSYAVGGDILSEIARYTSLLVDYERAVVEVRSGDASALRSELSRCIFTIREQVQDEIARFRHAVETRFSDVSSMADKKSQNTFFLNRTEKILIAVEDIEKATRAERYSPVVRDVEAETYREIGSRYQGWVATLSSIQERLREFLFQFRKIEAETKKVHALARFLADKSDDDISGMLTTMESETDWIGRIAEPAAIPEPDIDNQETRIRLAELFSEIRPKEEAAPPVEIEIGKPMLDEESNMITDEVSEFEQAMLDFLSAVDTSQEPVSVLGWLSDDDSRLLVPEEWLEQVLTWAAGERNCGRSYTAQAAAPKTPRCGNVEVEDLLVCRAA